MSLEPVPSRYSPQHPDDVLALVRQHPFAWVVSHAGEHHWVTPLPLRPLLDAHGRLAGLSGHFARANAQVQQLREQSRALFLFMGPHAYVSPSWLEDRTQAPTWNYACAVFDCALSWPDEDGSVAVLRDQVDAMEAGRPNAWNMDEMGARFERLARGVVCFHARILAQRAVFKLGQDESAAQFAQIIAGLQQAGEHELVQWMGQRD